MNFVAADETCVGMRRKDNSYDFDLPEGVTLNVQNDKCDLEWTIDVSTLTLLILLWQAIKHFNLFLTLNVMNN